MAYLWQRPGWPAFTWDDAQVAPLVDQAAREQGRLLGEMAALGFELRCEAHLRTLTEDVVESSGIEGETLDPGQVRSSLARRLGLDAAGLPAADRHVDGVVEMMLDATTDAGAPLTAERLFGWHSALFPAGRSGIHRITVGGWREDRRGPMRVISGALGRERVHYEAPPAERVPAEMAAFLRWFEGPPVSPLVDAALAHLWFLTIHPFDDGNGRIARAIADLALTRAEGSPRRFYSMSAQIRRERSDYYRVVEGAQRGSLDVTGWLVWFLECLLRALDGSRATLAAVLARGRFWERLAGVPLNERQIKVLGTLLEGFEGKLTTTKWAKIARCSQDTAHRDIVDLIEKGALTRDPAGGRSTSYALVL